MIWAKIFCREYLHLLGGRAWGSYYRFVEKLVWSSCYRPLRILSHSLWVCWPFTLISKKNCLIISSKSFPTDIDPWVPLHISKYPLTPDLILVLRRYAKPNICYGVREICRCLDFSFEGDSIISVFNETIRLFSPVCPCSSAVTGPHDIHRSPMCPR